MPLLRMLRDFRKKVVWVDPYRLCNVEKFNHVQSPLSTLELGNKRLRTGNTLCELNLGEARFLARLYKKMAKLIVPGCKNGPRHAPPLPPHLSFFNPCRDNPKTGLQQIRMWSENSPLLRPFLCYAKAQR